jgi:metal-sulfur cluster biosynthetic enzyme
MLALGSVPGEPEKLMGISQDEFERLRKNLAAGKLEHRTLLRDCDALSLPGGAMVELEMGWEVTIIRETDDAYIVQIPILGGEHRIARADADALGKRSAVLDDSAGGASTTTNDASLEARVRSRLTEVNDPELPVSIVDLGLVYAIELAERSPGHFRACIEMTLTTQACGMGAMISRDIERAVGVLDEIDETEVRIVWDPPWTPHKISPEGKRKLGIE